ncbi:MAG: DUF2905 domain-containing protein [Chloroflexota bacterium]
MPAFDNLGKMLVILGLTLAGFGLLLWLAGRVPFLGRLPGDISLQSENVSCFFPLATMLLLSLALTVLLNLIGWFLRR